MNKTIKIVLGIIGALIALVIIAVILFAVFFDANAYRGQIVATVQEKTGRSMTLGAIHVSLFPTLGLKIDDATLGNAEGFGEQPFAQIGEVDVGVRVLPLLFDHELDVESIYLMGLSLDLQRNAKGVSNWDDLLAKNAKASGKPASAKNNASSAPAIRSIHIGSVHVSGASVRYRDATSGQDVRLEDFSFEVGALGSSKPSIFKTSFKTISSKPAVSAKINASGKLTLNMPAKRYAVQNLKLEVEAAGSGIPGGKQVLNISGDAEYNGKAGSMRLAGGEIEVAGLIVHASLDVSGLNDHKLSFKGPIRVEEFSPRRVVEALGIDYQPQDDTALKTASLKAQISGTADSAKVSDLKIKLDDTTAQGSLALTSLKQPAAKFNLGVDTINVDRYMPVAAAQAARQGNDKAGAAVGDTPIPVDKLDTFSADGTLKIGKLVLHGVKMSDASVRINTHKGAAKKVALSAKLYGGSIDSHTGITPGSTPRYSEKMEFKGVDLGPLVHDATGKDILKGTGNITANLTSSGKTVNAVRQALGGKVALSLKDGALKGLDLARIIRQVSTLVNSGGDVSAAMATTQEETDLSTVSVSGTIHNGVLKSDDLHGATPLLRLAGDGTVDLVNNRIDYTLKPTVVNTTSAQGGKTLSELRGVTIPVHVSGPFSKISYKPDLAAIVKNRAKQEIKKQLDKHKEDIEKGRQHLQKELNKSIQKGLKGLFGGG